MKKGKIFQKQQNQGKISQKQLTDNTDKSERSDKNHMKKTKTKSQLNVSHQKAQVS